VFNQQFLTLLRAGLPILNSLELLIKRQKDAQLRQILENVRDRVKGGELLSDAFAAQGIIPKIYTTTLMAGEKSGNIDEVLTRYIGFQRLAMTFRKKLFVSLIYPTLLITVVMIMVTFLFTYVVPKFADLFNSLDAKLPAITVFMLNVGRTRRNMLRIGSSGWRCSDSRLWRWKETDSGADRIDRVILSMPLLGDIRLKHQVASFSRMLSTLLQGGLPLVPAMETAGLR
jgi:type IV pilus assembly protein PilC